MGKFTKPKKFGQRIARPVALEDQLLKDKFPKVSTRTKGKIQDDAPSKRKLVNVSNVLSQLRQLEDDCADLQQKDPSAVTEEDFDVELDEALPENVDSILKNFQQEMELNTAGEDPLYAAFMTQNAVKDKTFLEQMKDTFYECRTEIKSQADEQSDAGGPIIPEEVRKACEGSGEVLRNYRSGPIPKIIKAGLPKMRNWLHLLYLTNPDQWSAAAMFQLTRTFRSQKPEMAQVFYNKVLLPRCRDDIAHYKRLNYHLYQALGRALFKQVAFFKGIILPLCMSGDCTLREAIVFGSVLANKSVLMLASAAAIIKISQMQYSGANSIFLRILLNKMYALPWAVLDAVVEHFVRFKCEARELPVLWHQSLLTFVQRYKQDLSHDQKAHLRSLSAFHSHKSITPEVLRELDNSKSRETAVAL